MKEVSFILDTTQILLLLHAKIYYNINVMIESLMTRLESILQNYEKFGENHKWLTTNQPVCSDVIPVKVWGYKPIPAVLLH